jgi:hypothetical protein
MDWRESGWTEGSLGGLKVVGWTGGSLGGLEGVWVDWRESG